MQTPLTILAQYWGYSAFRPMQEEIIESVLAGKDTLALLPTGGGKSICFQVPAMVKDGICLVVSPLIALMKDQVENLKKKGIPAVAIVSGMHPREIDIALDNCAYGKIKFLYVSPERLKTTLFLQRLQKMNVNLLAVDEAHCISQWGYDFRPAYLEIANLRELLPGIPILALTATATTKVVIDITEKLAFRKANTFQKSFERKNLAYVVLKEENKMARLLKVIDSVHGSAIVYVRTRKRTKSISDYLNSRGIKSDYYHAGLDPTVRDQKQKNWVTNRCRVIVSTNAFGMGIDKPDVRSVVHLDLPDSLEAYFQEAGRAGRDEHKAYAVVLFEQADITELQERIEGSFPPPDFIRRVYQALANFLQLAIGSGEGQTYAFDLSDFSRQYNFKPAEVFHSLRFLEKEGLLALSEALYLPSRVRVLLNNRELYEFKVSNRALEPYLSLLLRSYTGLFEDFVNIREAELARRARIGRAKIDQALKHLNEIKVIEYLPQTRLPQLHFLRERVDASSLRLSHEHYAERKKEAESRMESVMNYVQSTGKCRSKLLLQYFGETDTYRCGTCDVCLERNKLDLSNVEFDQIVTNLKDALKAEALDLDQLVALGGQANEKRTIKAIRWLEDSGQLITDEEGHYSWVESDS